MRMLAQDRAFCRKPRVDETDDAEALRRLRILEGIEMVRSDLSAAAACRAFGVSRATYYAWRRRLVDGGVAGLVPRSSRPRSHPGRRWTRADAMRVVRIRRETPWAGKARIALDLAARWPERALSEATVGRILRWAVERGRVRPCSFCEGRAAAKRRRDFTGAHARRWKPRDRHFGVQFDHMTVHIDGVAHKEFRAVCPRTRLQHAKVYSRATAGVARAFLREAVRELDIRAVQVDGGSEFMAAFEEECRALGLPLLVLPPRSPQLNGIVERANRTARAECWSQYRGELTCAAMNEALAAYLDYYNNRRRHRSLGMKTPAEFARMMAAAA